VTPEYNHGILGVLKNAIDFLYAEWNDKAAGFAGFGSAGGACAVAHLRLVMAEVRDREQPGRTIALHRLRELQRLQAEGFHEKTLDQVIAGGGALKGLRADRAAR
jgi:NAD(P)H-dependent FMN reductase